jgi:large subunit ribosomal protein L34
MYTKRVNRAHERGGTEIFSSPYFTFWVDLNMYIVYSVSQYIDSIIMPKRTYQPKKRKRATTHGFLVRAKSPTGAKVLQARRRKGRAKLAV